MPYPRTPEQIVEKFNRRRLTLAEAAQLDACKRICSYWHNRFGGCYVLRADRLRAICQWLCDPSLHIFESNIIDAIEAYHIECTTNKDRAAKAIPPRTIDSFLTNALETWLERGAKLRASRKAATHASRVATNEHTEKGQILAALNARKLEFGQVLRQAYIDLSATDPTVPASFDDPRVRARMLEILTLQSNEPPRRQDAKEQTA